METRLANLYVTAQAMGIDMEEYLQHFRTILQPAIYLAQEYGLPLGYRFDLKMGAKHPNSPTIFQDHHDFLIKSDEVIKYAQDRKFAPIHQQQAEKVLYLKQKAPPRTPALLWLQTISTIRWFSKTYPEPKDYVLLMKNHDPEKVPCAAEAVKIMVETGLLKEGDHVPKAVINEEDLCQTQES